MTTSASLTAPKTLTALKELVPGIDTNRLEQALEMAAALYGDRRLELVPELSLLTHAMESVAFLAEFCRDEDALVACVLQHALKCPEAQLSEIGTKFGRPVRDMVSRIHLLSHLYTTDWRKSVEDMKIMLVSVADDVRVLLVALCVSCVMLRHLHDVKQEYRMRLCRQALFLFAPVAARLGIYALKYRLESAAFPECYPTDSQHIAGQLQTLHESSGRFLPDTGAKLKAFLLAEGIKAEIKTREKQPYSIFQKMHSKSVSALEKITDLFAIRVIVPELADCYQTLGHLHRLATPISHRFKDYISFPKPNGYQSLHTSLIGLPGAPKNVMVEVQIRTQEMHREAEYGVAAHWFYKEKGKTVLSSAKQLQLSDVLLKQQTVDSDSSSGKSEERKLADHIYVLTPRGDIMELPEGGTPLDFAFVLHTDLGLRFKAARVNGTVVPISYNLENGDVVEIMTHKHPRPALHWIDELVMSSARSKLKSYFFSHNRPQFLAKGKDAVNAELKSRGEPQLDGEYSALALQGGVQIPLKEREDLLVKVGMGSVRTSSVLRSVAPRPTVTPRSKTTRKTVARITVKDRVAVKGEQLSMPYRFAKCCSADTAKPKPEHIVGVVTRAGTLSVHRQDCHMVKAANPERTMPMHWVE